MGTALAAEIADRAARTSSHGGRSFRVQCRSVWDVTTLARWSRSTSRDEEYREVVQPVDRDDRRNHGVP